MAESAKYFSKGELSCSHCGDCKMEPAFLEELDKLREAFGKPMTLSSAYRCLEHPVEINKAKGGSHTKGRAVDVLVNTEDAFKLLRIATTMNFTGVGFSQKGDHGARFIHLDNLTGPEFTRPTIWSY